MVSVFLEKLEMSIAKELSKERKQKQKDGIIPKWYTTAGYQLFKEKYDSGGNVKQRYETISKTLANHYKGTCFYEKAESKFFELLWKGWLSPSTPILANTGTNKGLSVSCSGNVVEDSIEGFYNARRECAILTKQGFGTSSYIGNIRARGTPISTGGKASGILPVLKGFIQDSRDVSQGNTRRGAWAGYLNIEHGDFFEICDYVYNNPDDCNIGWIVSNSFIERLNLGDNEALLKYQKALKTKIVTGRGYFCFIDKINSRRIPEYVKNNHYVQASNLCNEIALFSDKDNTFSCVLSSLNIAKWDEWKDTDAVFWSVLFLDAVVEDLLVKAKDIPGLEKICNFASYSRAIGLGQCGWVTYLQDHNIPFESLEAHFFNSYIASYIQEKALEASRTLANELGEPELLKGSRRRNSHLIAIAPTKSTALIMGGISEGISPFPANTYLQNTAGGEMNRINPSFLKLMKQKGMYNKNEIAKITQNQGSVQTLEWLSPLEKQVFKTAFEIDQQWILRFAEQRGKYIDQWQSLNLFFPEDCKEKQISEIHKQAFLSPNILGLYYCYTKAGVSGSTGECSVCQ